MADNKYQWCDSCVKLATKLLDYKNNRELLIQKQKKALSGSDVKAPVLAKNKEAADIDPFTVFGIFNRNLKDNTRKLLFKSIADELELEVTVPEDFQGSPIPDSRNSTFYQQCEAVNKEDIDNLWDLFEAAIRFADKGESGRRQRFINTYDRAIRQKI